MTSSDPMSNSGSGSRRPRAEAPRSESVRVRLSPVEAAVVGEAAGRAGMSVGAWVGEIAVGRARADAAGDEPAEAGGAGPSSWRELVAALVALRAEVAALRRVPERAVAVSAAELLDGQPARDVPCDGDRDGVVTLLRRIDVVTATAVNALSAAQRASRPGRGRSVRS